MKLRALLGPLNVREHGGALDVDVHSVTRDSREVTEGVLFVAIAGARVDGHRFVEDLPAGSAAVVTTAPSDPGVPWLRVDDTRLALALAAAELAGHPADEVPVVGVTGTNGKTTVTSLLAQALEAVGRSVGRIGTVGVRIAGQDAPAELTTPEAPQLQAWFREAADAGCDLVAMEASSIGLEQHRVDGFRFHVGVFTNLSRDHLDHHGTMEAYGRAKARLFEELLRPEGGLPRALLCADDPAWTTMGAPQDRWTYGFDRHADVRIVRWLQDAWGMSVLLETPEGAVALKAPLVGRFNALNLTAAWAAGVLAGVPSGDLVTGLARASAPRGRMELVPNERGLLVVVDYAHTPDALAHAIDAVDYAADGAVWVVFGCGGDRDRGKRPEMGHASLSADQVVVTSDNPRSEDPMAIIDDILAGMGAERPHVVPDRSAAIVHALTHARPGDAVLIAGKGHETYQEVDGIRHTFDDVAVARAVLES